LGWVCRNFFYFFGLFLGNPRRQSPLNSPPSPPSRDPPLGVLKQPQSRSSTYLEKNFWLKTSSFRYGFSVQISFFQSSFFGPPRLFFFVLSFRDRGPVIVEGFFSKGSWWCTHFLSFPKVGLLLAQFSGGGGSWAFLSLLLPFSFFPLCFEIEVSFPHPKEAFPTRISLSFSLSVLFPFRPPSVGSDLCLFRAQSF